MLSVKISHLRQHPTKKTVLIKFLFLVLVFGVYFTYLYLKFGLLTAGWLGVLTWSFFVLCTPVADAGFLLDFPLRVILGVRMVYAELAVWLTAVLINLLTLSFNPLLYTSTYPTRLLYLILTRPVPYWLIILVSAGGTFLSVYFGDELLDVIAFHQRRRYHQHKHKYYTLLGLFIMGVFLIVYGWLTHRLNLETVQL